jgi:hypothetical protein
LAVLDHAVTVQLGRLGRHDRRFLHGLADGDATGQVREHDAIAVLRAGVFGLIDPGEVKPQHLIVSAIATRFAVRSEGFQRDILSWVHRNRHPTRFGRMAELPMRSPRPHFPPSVGFTSADHITRLHIDKMRIPNQPRKRPLFIDLRCSTNTAPQ